MKLRGIAKAICETASAMPAISMTPMADVNHLQLVQRRQETVARRMK